MFNQYMAGGVLLVVTIRDESYGDVPYGDVSYGDVSYGDETYGDVLSLYRATMLDFNFLHNNP